MLKMYKNVLLFVAGHPLMKQWPAIYDSVDNMEIRMLCWSIMAVSWWWVIIKSIIHLSHNKWSLPPQAELPTVKALSVITIPQAGQFDSHYFMDWAHRPITSAGLIEQGLIVIQWSDGIGVRLGFAC